MNFLHKFNLLKLNFQKLSFESLINTKKFQQVNIINSLNLFTLILFFKDTTIHSLLVTSIFFFDDCVQN